ncbi:MAG: hypothetical protein Q8Q90_00885 [bacterium]|nr:hypothetical protein [bacterium]
MSKDMLDTSALAEVAGPLKDFAEKLGGEDGSMWLAGFKRFLRKENPWNPMALWHTLTIGGVLKDELLKKFGDGFFISDWAKDIMSKPEFTTFPESTGIQLAKVMVKDLGFTEMPTTTELFNRIKEVGSLCPAEVGPHLRLAFTDQPKGDWFSVAMEPISGSDGFLLVFSVRRVDDGRLWLISRCADPDDRWGLESGVVFCLSK